MPRLEAKLPSLEAEEPQEDLAVKVYSPKPRIKI